MMAEARGAITQEDWQNIKDKVNKDVRKTGPKLMRVLRFGGQRKFDSVHRDLDKARPCWIGRTSDHRERLAERLNNDANYININSISFCSFTH